jgi:acyl carrier protein
VRPNFEQVTKWILARHQEVQAIDADYDLIDNRLIDSLGFLEFIILIERLTGKSIEIDTINIDNFRSLRSIEQSFFADTHPV